jgi:hypothetical protein
MENSAYPVGQVIFLRTDTPDYAEENLPFTNLDEMVRICTQAREGLLLEKLIIYAMPEGEPVALTLGFVSSTKGQRPVLKDQAAE